MIRIHTFAVLAAALLWSGGADAQQRCEGTLCDLYYGGSAPEQATPAKPAAPTPMTVPTMPNVSGAGTYISNMFSRSGDTAPHAASAGQQAAAAPTAAPQSEGFFHMGGGGVTGQKPAGECGGTICNLLHGHSSDDDSDSSVSQSVNGVPQSRYGGETASAEPVAAPISGAVAPVAQPSAERRVAAHAAPKPPACALKGGDPWACYRR